MGRKSWRAVDLPLARTCSSGDQQQPQQTGVPFIIRQQVQPACIMVHMQSQQAWIILQHSASPEVQVMQQPLAVISILHMPMVRAQVQTHMPFIMQQQEHMPPASMVHRFCIMAQAVLSSHSQNIFMPPVHFSMRMVQRGTIIMFGAALLVPVAGIPMPGMPVIIAFRSIIMVVPCMRVTPLLSRSWPGFPQIADGRTSPSARIPNKISRLGLDFLPIRHYDDDVGDVCRLRSYEPHQDTHQTPRDWRA
jgi:hypothetical protein